MMHFPEQEEEEDRGGAVGTPASAAAVRPRPVDRARGQSELGLPRRRGGRLRGRLGGRAVRRARRRAGGPARASRGARTFGVCGPFPAARRGGAERLCLDVSRIGRGGPRRESSSF